MSLYSWVLNVRGSSKEFNLLGSVLLKDDSLLVASQAKVLALLGRA